MTTLFRTGPVDPALVERVFVVVAAGCVALCVVRVVVWLGVLSVGRRRAAYNSTATIVQRPPAIEVIRAPEQRIVTTTIASVRNEAPVHLEMRACPVDDVPVDGVVQPVHEFVVRVLGPVDIVDRHGRQVAVERGKSTELLAWLVLHRTGTTRSAARAAIWSTDVSDATVANVVSGARRALSRHLPGEAVDWLGATHAELLQLDRRVVSDLDLFNRHLAEAHRQYGSARSAALGSALALVRGAPLLGSRFRWADDEALTSSLTLSVVDAAREYAESALLAGDDAGVLRATAAGLVVLPGHEELIALRLRAHHAAGRHAALRSEWEAYCRAAQADGWSPGPAAWLAELVEELLGSPAGR